jgi:hypothetical protein
MPCASSGSNRGAKKQKNPLLEKEPKYNENGV